MYTRLKLRNVSHLYIKSYTSPSWIIAWPLAFPGLSKVHTISPCCALIRLHGDPLECLVERRRRELTSTRVLFLFVNADDVDLLRNGDVIRDAWAALLLNALVACLALWGWGSYYGHEVRSSDGNFQPGDYAFQLDIRLLSQRDSVVLRAYCFQAASKKPRWGLRLIIGLP